MLKVRLAVLFPALLLPALLSGQFVIGSGGFQGPQLTPPASTTPPDQRCVLQGRVTNSQTGETLKKVTIRLVRHGSGAGSMGAAPTAGPQGYSATSEADGSFRIDNIEPGDYNLSGQRSGYLNTQYGAKGRVGSGTVLSLRPAQQMTDINLALRPQAVITGKVVDEDGDPVAGVIVQVLGEMWQRGKLRYLPRGAANTNDLGEFRSANLSPGKYYLCAQRMNYMRMNEPPPAPGKPDIRPIRTCYPDAVTFDAATPLEIKAGQDLSGIDIRLHSAQTYHVRGKVVGNVPAGDAQQVTVNLLARDEQMFFFGNQSMVSKDQSFDIPGVAPGSYTLSVMVMSGKVQGLAQQPVDVGAGDVNDVVLTVVPPGSLRGNIRVDGTPQAGAAAMNFANVHVNLMPAEMTRMMSMPSGQSSADGSFRLENIQPGKYDVQANAPAGTYLKSVRYGQQEVLGKELDLSGGAAGDLELVFRYGTAEVDGTVQAAESGSVPAGASSTGQPAAPPAATSILLVPDVLNSDGSGMHFGSTNQSGTFTFKNVPPGHYRAYAFEEVNTNDLQNPEVLKQFESRGTEVELKENDRKQIQLPLISAEDVQQIFARLGIDSPQ